MSSEHQLLAHCYAAEALCNLQSPQQAAQQLHIAVTLQSFSDRHQAERPVAEVGADAAPQVCNCICPFDCLSVCLFDCSFACSFDCSRIHPFIHACMLLIYSKYIVSSTHTCIHPSIHPLLDLFVHSFIHSCICSFLHSFGHSCMHSFIHAFIIHSFIRSLFTHSFIHEFMRSCFRL